MTFIRYITKSNGFEYASLAKSIRRGKRVKQEYIGNLGRVVDKDAGVFRSMERGLFRYTLEDGYCDLPNSYVETQKPTKEERLILDFGDSYFLHRYIESQAFMDVFCQIPMIHADSMLSLIFYRVLTDKKAYCSAERWWQGNYASLLFPQAKLTSQQVSELLVALGQEEVQREFFRAYFEVLYGNHGTSGIVTVSSGLPNASKLTVTQLSSHNGDVNMEARLIYVIDRKTGMPLYFRYCAGNIVDVSTLCTTLAELRQYHISVDYAIADANDCSEGCLQELYQNRVKFITRLPANLALYKHVAREHLPNLMSAANAVRYGNRLLCMKKVEVDVLGHPGFAYLGMDMDTRSQRLENAVFAAMDEMLSTEAADSDISGLDAFLILSSEDIGTEEVLPLYYTRQQIEQVFDFGKNNADILSLRMHSEDAFRGHLMLTFLATVVLRKLQIDILIKYRKSAKTNPEDFFMPLRNQKCKVYFDEIVPQKAVKSINDIYRLFQIKCPSAISKRV